MSVKDLSDEDSLRFERRDASAATLVEALLVLADDFTAQAAALAGIPPDDGGAGRAQMAVNAVIRGIMARGDIRSLATMRGIAGGLVAAMLEAGIDCGLLGYAHNLFHHLEGGDASDDHPLATIKPEGSA